MRNKLSLVFLFLFMVSLNGFGQSVVTPNDILQIQRVKAEQFSPDGTSVLYTVSTPRNANEEPGPAHKAVYISNLETKKESRLLPSYQASMLKFSPDGKYIGFLHKMEKEKSQVWIIPVSGGEPRQLTNSDSDVTDFHWHPKGNALFYLAQTPPSKKEMKLKERGYDFIFYEENLKQRNIYEAEFSTDFELTSIRQLTSGVHVWDFIIDKSGKKIAYSASDENLIDQKYMFRRIYVLNLENDQSEIVVKNRGKLGNYAFNSDASLLAFTSAYDINDHAVSQALILDFESNNLLNLTPPDFKGHMTWIEWKNDQEVVVLSEEGVYPKLRVYDVDGTYKGVLLNSETEGVVFGEPLYTEDFKKLAFTGSSPYGAYNVYSWDEKKGVTKLSSLNSHLKGKEFGKQEVFRYAARDGMEIEGILMYPVDYSENKTYPLILYVHGGPESHHSNGWLSRYSTPGQAMAGKGYLVAYVNYRASTGYGVDFGMEGFADPAGKEFDDLADAIKYLINEKGADKSRVGMAGGSYGGYASAWFSTYYTQWVKATCVFVGVTDLISKKGTTDIPYEELLVHAKHPIEETWKFSLERSPVYWAHQSKTATLIYGGADDPRVHPSQSLELYRRMKMNNHPAVRLVQYPGEGHGNQKQVGQIDVLYRQINWLDWYVKDNKPIDGPMPPLDISDKYGLDWKL